MKNGVPHIVQYQGSKRILAPQILRYLPLKFNRLIEPFSGMAAITIAVARQSRTQRYLINDINRPLVSLLECAIQEPEFLITNYERLWNDQFDYTGGGLEHYNHVRELFNSGTQSPEYMLYLLARCVKGAARYGKNGNFNQSPDKRRSGTNPHNLAANVWAISGLLRNKVEFSSTDYKTVLRQAQEGDIVYMDPPYQGVSNVKDCRYISGIDFNEFVEAIEMLNKRNVDFIISYDGKCGEKEYGTDLPLSLRCTKILLNAGLSSQAILLGKKEVTYEALYISEKLQKQQRNLPIQMSVFENVAL